MLNNTASQRQTRRQVPGSQAYFLEDPGVAKPPAHALPPLGPSFVHWGPLPTPRQRGIWGGGSATLTNLSVVSVPGRCLVAGAVDKISPAKLQPPPRAQTKRPETKHSARQMRGYDCRRNQTNSRRAHGGGGRSPTKSRPGVILVLEPWGGDRVGGSG